MPRTKPLIREDPRAIDVKSKIGSIKAVSGLTDSDISRRTGIPKSTLSGLIGKRGDIGRMRLRDYWKILDLEVE